MKGLVSRYLFILASVISTNVFATEESSSSKIVHIQSYPEYGGGDFIFRLEIQSSICKGYWLANESPGKNATVSMILSAYHAGKSIKAWGHEEEINKWQGSPTHFCKLYTVAHTN